MVTHEMCSILTAMRCSMCVEVNCRGTHRADTFLYLRMSLMILRAHSCPISSSSATSSMVIRRFALIMSSTFPTFASVVAVRVRPAFGMSSTC
ncbi:hypothetical protein TNCT_336271 [Trichonephila clavata]|uniref:Uncharacterized protein n=1 Tax=Trichonephila clavata TaxID=2740835 RepID=A0A8X6LTS5_TRICU|nr:hypothetical protein TNCT_336271 [Trichonephila clavata]